MGPLAALCFHRSALEATLITSETDRVLVNPKHAEVQCWFGVQVISDLIGLCLLLDPDDRPSTEEIFDLIQADLGASGRGADPKPKILQKADNGWPNEQASAELLDARYRSSTHGSSAGSGALASRRSPPARQASEEMDGGPPPPEPSSATEGSSGAG